jgi:hypothetical protein
MSLRFRFRAWGRVALFLSAGVLIMATGALSGQDAASSTIASPGGAAPTVRPVPRDPGFPNDPASFPAPSGANPNPLADLLPIFFPAPPPVLGAELPAAPAVRDPLWAEFAPFVNEPFFAPLSTRLAQGNLNRRQRQRLDAYKSARTTLLAELRARLDAAAAPAARRQALQELAAAQEPRLSELAATADELRRELYQRSLLGPGGDWNALRNWRLNDASGKRSTQERLADEFSVLRAAIYYQEGLSPAQRQLLREVVIELGETLSERPPTAPGDRFEPEQIAFFLPHGSRFHVPGNASAETAAELAAFTAEKTTLKRELREALFVLDRESAGKRERALQELAARQEPRFVALEKTAEKLRVGLDQLSDPLRPDSRVGLPPALADRIHTYLQDKADLQRAAQKQAQDAAASAAPRPKSARASEPGSREALAQFEEANRARLAALATEARAIREEVARTTAAQAGGTAGKSVDALLADFMAAFKRQQLQSLYRDYRAAMFEPGLSSRQRQLLFDAALTGLDLTGVKDWQAVPE